ncbi:MAG: hypothetical protein ACRC5H_05810 [Treponemataceae bacterium]
MKKSAFSIFLLGVLSILIPFPGRFAYGIIVVLQLNLLCFFSLLVEFLIKKLKNQSLTSSMLLIFLVVFSALLYQIMVLFSPIIALTISFTYYLVCFSSFLFGIIFTNYEIPFKKKTVEILKRMITFTLFALLFFIFRDIAGYGTITLPVHDGLKEIVLFERSQNKTTFLASIPAGIIFLASITACYLFLKHLYILIKRSKDAHS